MHRLYLTQSSAPVASAPAQSLAPLVSTADMSVSTLMQSEFACFTGRRGLSDLTYFTLIGWNSAVVNIQSNRDLFYTAETIFDRLPGKWGRQR